VKRKEQNTLGKGSGPTYHLSKQGANQTQQD